MAIVVHIYNFKNSEKIHLAVELTSVELSSNDKYNNYISYYSYEESQVCKEEHLALAAYPSVKQGCGPVSGSGDVHSFYVPRICVHSHVGFGCNEKKYDENKHIYLGRFIIPTCEDNDKLFVYNESSILAAWEKFRPKVGDWENNKIKKGDRAEKEFEIIKRHCGTVVRNILENASLGQERKEKTITIKVKQKDKEGEDKEISKETVNSEIIKKSLIETINLAKTKENTKFFEKYYFKGDLLNFYNDYRNWKSFFERDPDGYTRLIALCAEKQSENKESDNKEVPPRGFIDKEKIHQSLRQSIDAYIGGFQIGDTSNLLCNKAISSLKWYISKRDEIKSEYTGLLGSFSGYNKQLKVAVVEKVINALEKKEPVELTYSERRALFDGRLYKHHISKFEEIIRKYISNKERLEFEKELSNYRGMFHR